jgi:hypothetical protein
VALKKTVSSWLISPEPAAALDVESCCVGPTSVGAVVFVVSTMKSVPDPLNSAQGPAMPCESTARPRHW